MPWPKDNWYSGLVFFFLLTLVLILLRPNNTLAHPGNTASDGCHYCRTRCDYWGVPWNQRHCHGGSITLPPAAPPPPPKIQTWTFNGQIYHSYSAYLEAKAAYEAEQRIKQEEENKRLQEEIERLKATQQIPTSSENAGSVVGINTSKNASDDTNYLIGALAIMGLLGIGWYFFSKRRTER